MKQFFHINARTVEEAVTVLNRFEGRARIVAGGTDILGIMKDRVLLTYPEALINLKTIPGLDGIEERGGVITIGALTRLANIAENAAINAHLPALARAAARTASPQLRCMGTIGGNICQDIRCWYYRHPGNRFPCLRKGGGRCYAIEGDNRYHSIFGGSVDGGCYAVHPSDTAPSLVALGAVVKTTKRTVPIEDFYEVAVQRTTILDFDEVVSEIVIPVPRPGSRNAFLKFALRKAIDFPIVNCAAAVTTSGDAVIEARICLNAVHVKPYRANRAEKILAGEPFTARRIEEAADAAVQGAQPLASNGYMVQIARTMVKRTLTLCVPQ
jgi:xanthine dehydrogenase YagS FAD-binding subunit